MTDEPPAGTGEGSAPPTPTPAHTPKAAATPAPPVVSAETVPIPPFRRSFFGNPFGIRDGKFEFNLTEGLRLPKTAKVAPPKG